MHPYSAKTDTFSAVVNVPVVVRTEDLHDDAFLQFNESRGYNETYNKTLLAGLPEDTPSRYATVPFYGVTG